MKTSPLIFLFTFGFHLIAHADLNLQITAEDFTSSTEWTGPSPQEHTEIVQQYLKEVRTLAHQSVLSLSKTIPSLSFSSSNERAESLLKITLVMASNDHYFFDPAGSLQSFTLKELNQLIQIIQAYQYTSQELNETLMRLVKFDAFSDTLTWFGKITSVRRDMDTYLEHRKWEGGGLCLFTFGETARKALSRLEIEPGNYHTLMGSNDGVYQDPRFVQAQCYCKGQGCSQNFPEVQF
ncbi:MAG: hypothetical protein KDD61_02205 [Bdellovibrionales bacterium]|nr:hypothetical protein [Bdellovibrionales bacterium]